jgi:hypothetical protein
MIGPLGQSGRWERRGGNIVLFDGEQLGEYEWSGEQETPPRAPVDCWVLPANVRAAGEAQTVRYDGGAPWNNGANCTGRLTDGARELGNYIRRTFAGVTTVGGYNCRPNTANRSETSMHGVGRAIDIMIPPVRGRANSAVGDPIANWLVQNAAAIGIQYIIWNRVSWGGNRRPPKERRYTGPVPHIDHIHAELTLDAAARRTPWFRTPHP